MTPSAKSDSVRATAWLDDQAPSLEGHDVEVRADLTDVDEVGVIVETVEGDEVVIVHLDRVHAIALAGQLASSATRSPTDLPKGHVNG